MPRDSTDVQAHRFVSADVARCLGIFLVYHGHIVERMMYLGQDAAAHQYKFIYSFHMPLFFVLAGCIAKDLGADHTLWRFLRSRVVTRVLPLVFFNLLLALTSLVIPRDFPPIPLESVADYGNALVMSLTWLTVFNVPTWFLMCLVTVEVVHFVLFRFVRQSTLAIALLAAGCLVLGLWFNRDLAFFPGQNWWFWNEAPVAYAFYLFGIVMRRIGLFDRNWPREIAALGAVLAFAGVYFSYDLNQGPFRLDIKAVVILASGHGDLIWFTVTSVLGICGTIALAQAFGRHLGWMSYVGRNALIIFCLNGIFYHHVNGPVAASYVGAAPQDGWTLAIFAGAASIVSIALTIPVVILFNRWVPQLVGQPQREGPLLPRLG
ncbi:acyltransferase family protein [Dongia sp.]|uniref:acyltransferase family protein n=1 Tax=Dongia sp. TaxID=1977262 RepID=UPI0035AE2B49